MKYKHWMLLISVLNLFIVITASLSIFNLMTIVLAFMSGSEPSYFGQPFALIMCIVLSIINTPLIAMPVMKEEGKLKEILIYAVAVPFAALIVGGAIAVACGVSYSLG